MTELSREVVYLFLFNFVFFYTAFNIFTWFRSYVPIPVGMSVCLVLSFVPLFISVSNNSNLTISDNLYLELFTTIVSACVAVLPIYLMLEALPFFARIIDILRGMQFAEVNYGQSRGSILEGLYNLLVPIVFFKMNLANYIISIRIDSFEYQSFDYLMKVSSDSMKFAFLSVLPIFAITISLDLVILVLTRLLGRVNVSFELTPLKSLLALFVLYLNSEIILETICPQINNFLLQQRN